MSLLDKGQVSHGWHFRKTRDLLFAFLVVARISLVNGSHANAVPATNISNHPVQLSVAL